jgi:hypothetical protein
MPRRTVQAPVPEEKPGEFRRVVPPRKWVFDDWAAF